MGRARNWEIADFIFIVLAGSLLHFVYGWSGERAAVGVFSPINESVWEHLKLLYFPALVFGGIEYIFLRKRTRSLITAKAVGILIGMLFTVAAFYSYTAIAGDNFLWADIGLFVLSAAIAAYCSYHWRNSFSGNIVGFNIMLVLFGMFVAFTFFTPDIFIFN